MVSFNAYTRAESGCGIDDLIALQEISSLASWCIFGHYVAETCSLLRSCRLEHPLVPSISLIEILRAQ